ncbi:hypothetical protein [Paenibacillus macerans]|uniref:hypothetical protein n=1 Tax=Paenibacillus macerans TaxID=44252 RepID=UPI00203BE051|nr:hypothetical protein [Paenibacillus macerans]MCM3701104.1 hypothetical protein [Paenibacillus macerans]
MEQPKLKDLRISGVGKASGGVYGNVTTDGIATLNGDISCLALTASGTLKVKGGSLEAGRFRLNGNGSGTCCMSGGDFRLDGILKLSGDVKFTTLTINGMLQAGGSSSGERAEINGGMKLGGSAEFEEMDIHGHIQVAGMLNAGQISLSLAGPASRVKEIGGEKITVRLKAGAGRLLGLLSPHLVPRLTAEVIEGDDCLSRRHGGRGGARQYRPHRAGLQNRPCGIQAGLRV